MDWLWQNPIANMYGPLFLLFYACVSFVTIIACRLVVRGLDWTGRMPPPPLPAAPDPYEIAYMRGGENEVTRSAIFALIKQERLGFSRQGKKIVIERTAEPPPRTGLGQVERSVYEWFERPRESGEVFKGGGLAAQLRGLCDGYEQTLRREHLLTPWEIGAGARLIRFAGAVVIGGLGLYKLVIALSQGRTNVTFLILLGLVSLGCLFTFTRLPRMSRRGRAHLERLQLAFERLKGGSTKEMNWPASYDGGDGRAVAHAVDPSLVALGVFGATALAAADYENYKTAFQRSATGADGGSSGGTGCGSSDSSSGGDSGSSCSGGSSCGGGCGGCGGD